MRYLDIKNRLVEKDCRLKLVFDNYSPPIEKDLRPDFVKLVEIIIGQQLSGAAASTIKNRLHEIAGEKFTPKNLLSIPESKFLSIGISNAKKRYILSLSAFILSTPTYFEELTLKKTQSQLDSLKQLKGVGDWTASIFLMSKDIFSDVYPYGDNTLEKSIKNIYGLNDSEFEEKLETIIKSWEPHKTLVCKAIWQYHDNLKNSKKEKDSNISAIEQKP